MLYGFGEVVDDVDGLGAHGLAGAALDALRSGPLGGLPRVEALDELVVFGSALQVQQVHGDGDLHALGAVLYAVAAVRARDEVHAAQGRDGTVDGAALLILSLIHI